MTTENTTAPVKVWGIAALAPKQKPAVDAHCFGDCGQISMGGVIDDPVTGGLMVCCQPTCPHMAEEMEGYGTTLSFGQPHTVTLRLLKPVDATAVQPDAHCITTPDGDCVGGAQAGMAPCMHDPAAQPLPRDVLPESGDFL